MSLSPEAVPPAVPEARLREVLTRYALPGPARLTWLRRGFNDHYTVQAGPEQYILRVYLTEKPYIRGPRDIGAEVEALRVLAQQGVSVSAPMPTREGRLLENVEHAGQVRPLALFSFALGEELRGGDFSEEAARHLGLTLARVHEVADTHGLGQNRYTLDETVLVDRPVEALRRALGPEADGLVAYGERLKARLRLLPRTPGAFGFIHGDLHTGNLRVEGDRCTLFDFDHGGLGWRAYDLAVVRMSLPDAPWETLLSAYRSVRPFTDEEEAALPLFAEVRRLWDPGDFLAMMDTGAWGRKSLSEKGRAEVAGQIQELLSGG